jgi:uncharacterized protein
MPTRRNFIKSSLVAAVGATGIQRLSAAENVATPQVDRRPLGRIGTPVSIIGLGLGSAFTEPWKGKTEEGRALLNLALDHGINFWDTSRGYGPSEEMIAPVVEKRRQEIYLVTKSSSRDYDGFMRDVETSLKTLRTDRIDLMHIWNLPANADLAAIEGGALKAVLKLKDQKVIGDYGISGHSGAAILTAAIQRLDPAAILTVFPCTRDDQGRYEDEVLPLARERKMGVIAMKMVRRARNADLNGSDLIRYALGLKGISCGVVGLDTEAHLRENLKMTTSFQPLKAEEQAYLQRQADEALAHIPTPWERPGYQDGFPA